MKTQRITTIAGLILILFVLVIANCPFQYTTVSTEGKLQRPGLRVAYDEADVCLPVAAGWPMKFYYRYDHADGVPAYTRWLAAPLIVNIVLLGGAFALLVVQQRRSVPAPSSDSPTPRRRLSIRDLIVATLLIALPLGYWQWLHRNARQELELAKAFQGVATYEREADLPALFARWIPAPLVAACMRITHVSLNAPDDKAVAAAMQLPHLKELRIGGGQYDLTALDPLPNFRQLTVFQLSGRLIDPRSVQLISTAERIRVLNLSRTNMSASAVELISDMPRLRQLNLVDTGVRLEDIKRPICPSTLSVLGLPRPRPGAADSLTLRDYPELITLLCASNDAGINASVCKVHLTNLPKLQTLALDQLQKIALQLEGLPSLEEIKSIGTNWQQRISASESIPGSLWSESLDLVDLPALKSFNFYGPDNTALRIHNTPQLDVVGLAAFRRNGDGTSHYVEKLSPQVQAALIEGFGDGDGPRKLDLAAVPLAGADLSPLSRNPRLAILDLSHSGTTYKEWASIGAMPQLEELRIAGNAPTNSNTPLDRHSITSLLKQFPNLQSVTCHAVCLISLRIENNPHIRKILVENYVGDDTTTVIDLPYQRDVRLIDVPAFSNALRIYPAGAPIHLEGVPSLRGLALSSPLTPGSKLSGFRDLQWFAAGGAEIDDALAAELLNCQQLEHLTLAYTNISLENLTKLVQTKPLRTLDLTGSRADDSVFADWPGLTDLQELTLDSTQVSEQTVARLSSATSLTTLSLNHIPISESTVVQLSSLKRLTRLRLAGSTISPDQTKQLLDQLQLTELDLSGQTFSDEHAQAIIASRYRVQQLGLRGSQVDPQAIERLAGQLPALTFDLEGAALPAELEGRLLASDRLKVQEDPNISWAIVMGSGMGQPAAPDPQARPTASIIDAQSFAPQRRDLLNE